MNIELSRKQKAGAIVLHPNDSSQIALIYRAKERDWSFPKGHIEKGETPEVTCKREIKEETGLEIKILLKLPDNMYSNNSGTDVVVSMFLAQSLSTNFINEHLDDEIRWTNIYEVERYLTYDNLKEYYRNILPILSNSKNNPLVTAK